MICPEELVTLITATAIGLAKGKSIEEIDILAGVFVQLGDTLATIAIQKGLIEDCCNTSNDANNKSEGEQPMIPPT